MNNGTPESSPCVDCIDLNFVEKEFSVAEPPMAL
jgi:hypothetical protein